MKTGYYKILLIFFFIVISFNSSVLAQDNNSDDMTYDVRINNFLAFENVIKYNNSYYIPVDNLIAFLNARRDFSSGDRGSIYIEEGGSYCKRFEKGPFYVNIDTSRFSGWKMIYWNCDMLGSFASVFNNVEYVDLNMFSQRMGYKITFTNNRIDIFTNEYDKIRDKAKLRIVLLPGSSVNVTAAPEKMPAEPFKDDIAAPFAKASYQRLAELFKNIYGDRIDVITVDDYLKHCGYIKQSEKALKLLKENILYSDLTAGMGGPYGKSGSIFGKSFEWQQADISLTHDAKELFEDVLKTENAQGVVYTDIEQVNTYYNGFYLKLKGFCYLQSGVILPLRNDGFDFAGMYYDNGEQTVNGKAKYTYYPAYYRNDKLYYIMPLPFLYNGFGAGDTVEVVNKDTNEVKITSGNKKSINVKDMAIILNDRTITIEQYVSGMQTGQALAALDEVIPQMFGGLYYYLLNNTDGGDYAKYLYNLEALRLICDIGDSADFKKTYADLLLKNGFYEYASTYIKTNNITASIPEYSEMLALEALQKSDAALAEKILTQLIDGCRSAGDYETANLYGKKIIYLYKLYIKDLEAKGDFAGCARMCEYLAGKDPSDAKQYYLSEAGYYEKAIKPLDAYKMYVRYLVMAKNDSAVEAKAHSLAVELKIDDLNDSRAKIIIRNSGFTLSKIKYYLFDFNKDKFKDILILSNNDVRCMIYVNGEYQTGFSDKKSDKETFEDTDKDGIPEIVAGRKGISGYSCLKFKDPFIEIVKYRELFSAGYIERQDYARVIKSKEAALAKLFHAVGSKNAVEYGRIPKKIKDFIEANKLNKEKKVITMSAKQKPGNTLTVIIQSNSCDKKVVFSFNKNGNAYSVADIVGVEDNRELWSTDLKGLVD